MKRICNTCGMIDRCSTELQECTCMIDGLIIIPLKSSCPWYDKKFLKNSPPDQAKILKNIRRYIGLLEEEKVSNFCIKTYRKCIGGAHDGGDGGFIDCKYVRPEGCIWKEEGPPMEEVVHTSENNEEFNVKVSYKRR